MISWKQFVQKIEQSLQINGIDPDIQPVWIEYIYYDGYGVKTLKDLTVKVNTIDMPKNCKIIVS